MEQIDGKTYYTATEVAKLVKLGIQSVYRLIRVGNQLGKLPVRTVASVLLISKDDLHDFRFVSSGRYGQMRVYRYNESFEKVYTEDPVTRKKQAPKAAEQPAEPAEQPAEPVEQPAEPVEQPVEEAASETATEAAVAG